MIRPTGTRLLIERLEGHGKERTLKSGIVIPATVEAGIQTKPDYFHARVVSLSNGARTAFQGDVREEDEVLVFTHAGENDPGKLYVGIETSAGLFVEPDDVLCVVDRDDELPVTERR